MIQAEYGFSPSCGFEIVWEAFLFLEDRGDCTGFVRTEGAARPGKEKTEGTFFLTAHCYKVKPFSTCLSTQYKKIHHQAIHMNVCIFH